MDIRTNGHTRRLYAVADVPAKVQEQFDYIVGDDCFYDRLFKYQDYWYDVHEFMHIVKRSSSRDMMAMMVDDDSPLLAWTGCQTDSYFSAILIRMVVVDEEEHVVVASASW